MKVNLSKLGLILDIDWQLPIIIKNINMFGGLRVN